MIFEKSNKIRYALIQYGLVVGTGSTKGSLPEPMDGHTVTTLPDNSLVQPGWRADFSSSENSWKFHPPGIARTRMQVSPVEFLLLFTAEESVRIKEVKAGDAFVKHFFDLIDHPRLTMVDLSLQSTIDSLGYLVSQGLLTDERKNQILSGIPQ